MTYAYNMNGSLTNATNDTFARAAYHKHSTLPVSIIGSGGSASLCYDSMGRRITKNGAVKVSYRRGLDGGIVPLSEKVGGDDVVYIKTPSGHRLSRSSTIYYRHSLDHLGSVRMRINATECVSAMYSTYGESIISAPLRYTFTGYELDTETNLMNAWRRIYSPKLARFIMVDPSLEYHSPYLYCDGDSFNFTDPTGEISSAVISGIITAFVLIVSIVIMVASYGTACPEVLQADASIGPVQFSMTEEDITESIAYNDRLVTEGEHAGSYIKTGMPKTRLEYAGAGAMMSGAGSAVTNGAGLITKAANGEHVSAWQGIKAMLIEPAIATVTGFIGGGIIGAGVMAFKGAFVTLSAYVISAAIQSASNALLTDAIERKTVDDAEIGLQIGVAVGEALLMSSVFTAVHPRAMVDNKNGLFANTLRNEMRTLRNRESNNDMSNLVNLNNAPLAKQRKIQSIRIRARFKRPNVLLLTQEQLNARNAALNA